MGKNKLMLLLVIPLILSCMLSQSVAVGADNEETLIIRVGAYENHPKIYTDSEGNIAGIFPDILTYIASQEEWQLEYVHGTWTECLERLETNEIDLMVDVGFSEERAEKYNFTKETVFVNWGVIYSREGLDVQSFADLQGKRMAVMQGSIHYTGKDGIKNLAERFDVNPVYVEVNDYYQVFELLDNEEVDAGVVNRIFGSLQESTYDVVRTALFFNPAELRFAMPRDSTIGEYLAGRIDYHMVELKNDPDSIYHQSLEAYLGIGGGQASFVPQWLLVTLAAIVGFALFLLSTVAILRRSVNRRTAELRHNEEKYRGVVERANDGICIIQDSKIVYANPRAQDILGYTPEELMSTSIMDHIHPDDIERVLDYYKRRMSGEDVPSRYESAIIHKDGSRIEVDFNVGIIQYEGKIAELVIVRDITERKHAMEALQESEERLRIMFESVTDGITVTDLEGVITNVNTKLVEIHGASSKDDILGKNALELIAKRDHEEATANLGTALEGGKSGNGRYSLLTLLKMDGSEFPGEIGSSVLKDTSGKPVGFIGITRDITERKQAEVEREGLYKELELLNKGLEEKIKQRTKEYEEATYTAEAANKTKSEFLASMSHELRTPLNSIIGFSQVLQEQYFGKLNEKQVEYVKDVLESAWHLLSLINDILDLSKIEAGKMELELDRVNIKDLLESSLIMVKEKALKHRISLNTDIGGDLENPSIIADERRLKQVMFNLLSNAAKFTPDGGTITIAGRKEGQELQISVSDTGIGVSPEYHERIFEEFYQVSNKLAGKTAGTGLGLPVTRRIVEMHSGRIWVESEGTDKGSRFTFTLPIMIAGNKH
ncbi:PAS domain S-box protein [Chloroflexota bacterium]